MSDGATVYDRIGGEATIAALVDDFYDRVLKDPELAPFFEKTSMEQQQRMQREFFAAALGGPIQYTGRPLSHVHHGLGIQRNHFSLFVEHLLETLQSRSIDHKDTMEIIDRIQTYADDIIGGAGGLDG